MRFVVLYVWIYPRIFLKTKNLRTFKFWENAQLVKLAVLTLFLVVEKLDYFKMAQVCAEFALGIRYIKF